MTTTCPETSRPRTSLPAADDPALAAIARRLLNEEIDFIPNREFQEDDAERTILGPDGVAGIVRQSFQHKRQGSLPADLPAHLGRLCEEQLLDAKQESDLFRQFNYLRFRANAVRSQLDPANPSRDAIERTQRFLQAAQLVQERIIKANIRLVISIVKKFVSPHQSFDELLSEGILSLMQAVDKFDYSRGFRFSTYAYRAISRHTYRMVSARHSDRSRFTTGASEAVFDAEDEGPTSSLTESNWEPLRGNLAEMMSKLDRRERFIVEGRFALGANRKSRTFQSLADVLGISKERVRQLEQRAVNKLRNMAAERKLEELVEAE